MHEGSLPDALLGWSGFVGSVLNVQHRFDARYRKNDIDKSAGHDFATLVCAAAPGSMFAANRNPESDSAAIDELIAALSRVRAQRMVLVSTIAVLSGFDGQQNEETTDFQTETPYGVNRRRLETFCSQHFETCLILRLPALFGPGLRKNFIFDILNPVPSMLTPERIVAVQEALPSGLRDTITELYTRLEDDLGLMIVDRAKLAALPQRAQLETKLVESGLSAQAFTNPCSTFQFYDMSRLWKDITRGLRAGLHTLHIATEPLLASDVYRALTDTEMAPNEARLHREDMHTCYATLWGRDNPYIAGTEEVLAQLRHFYSEMHSSQAIG